MTAQLAPLVSVVVPTYRRPDLLARCLEALCAQSLAGDRYEVIVADDAAGLPDDVQTQTIVARCQALTGGRPAVRYVPVTATQGPAGARNVGWRRSTGRIVAFTDDDTIPDRDWLAEGVAAIERGDDAVGGTIHMPLPALPTDYERDAAGLAEAEFATANCFVTRAALQSVGGFDERFTSAWREDSDLQFMLLEAGRRVGFASDAIVVHPVRPAAFGVSVGQQRKVVFDALLFKKHRAFYRARILPSPPWPYFATVIALIATIVAGLAGAWSVATTSVVVWLALVLRFALRRLHGTSRRPSHVIEMIVTSMAIPPLAVWWRVVGAWRFRVAFL